jgi:xanthine dehydrogenase/oxidase
MLDAAPYTDLVFYLNGKRIVRRDVDPTTLLADFLRSPEVGLTGTKIACKQGGCGACTVLLSRWDEQKQAVEHTSINSCLRPLAALDGMSVTTVEGTGSVQAECISIVQDCLARNNGTQCGYCTPGWIMNMTAAVAQNGPTPGTKAEIEGLFDGNICRCTGYRPILYGFKKQFASDWNPAVDEEGCMRCIVDPGEQVDKVAPVAIAFPEELKKPPRSVAYAADGYQWLGATALDQVLVALGNSGARANVRLVGGNTSIGIYPRTVENPHVFIDMSNVAELRKAGSGPDGLYLGGGMRYTELLDFLQRAIGRAQQENPGAVAGLKALDYMAGRTAGSIVRNAATLAGNTMLVVRHADDGVPFPSDCFTALAALGATVRIVAPGWTAPQSMPLLDFASRWQTDPGLQQGCVLLDYTVPYTDADSYAQTYKTALRDVNAHSIANAGFRVRLDETLAVTDAVLVLGGVSPVACRLPRTEEALIGQPWSPALLARTLPVLRNEVETLIDRYAAHYAQLPAEGLSDAYRLALCESFYYKFFLEVAQWCELPVPPQLRSATERQARPVSRGTQAYASYPGEYPVNLPFIKLEAFLQATGEAKYTHDLPVPRRALNGAPVQSTVALGSCWYHIPGTPDGQKASPADVLAALQVKFPTVADYVSAIDVPGPVFGGTAGDDPLFAVSVQPDQCDNGCLPPGYDPSLPMWVSGFGQCIGMVMDENEQVAQEAAWYVQTTLCVFEAQKPLLAIPDTDAARNAIVYLDKPAGATWYSHIWQITRAGSVLDWVPVHSPTTPDAKAPSYKFGVPVPDAQGSASCTVVSSQQIVGSQLHFYMETQSCVAELLEDRQMRLFASTQSPDSIQGSAARVLNLPLNKVDVRVRRLGGGYGGKCGQSEFAANMAAVAAWKNTCTVRLAMLRQVDSAMFGHRHPLMGNYHIAIGDTSNKETHGKLLGFQVNYWWDGGRTYDCSFVISDTGSLRSDSAYRIPNWNCASDVCRTNKTTNTSMRTVGMLQSAIVVEDAIEAAAHSVQLGSEEVRRRNMYRQGDLTPYGEPLDSCYMREVFEYAMEKSDFHAREAAVQEFNSKNRWKKRGISLIPVKYGSGYNLTSLEQGGALIEVYDQDGTVLVRQGGIEMGQGLNTKIAQVVALALNVPLGSIRVAEMDTAVVPNPESTGASTGTSFNALPSQRACKELRGRLELYCKGLLELHGQQWCVNSHINYWDYPEGWRAIPDGQTKSLWQNIVSMAFNNRVNLSAQARVRVPGGTRPDTGLTFKLVDGVPASEPVDYFTGYTYSAACTEVEIDVLTGETTILRADVVYDAGKSLNPAIDVGQVEGGFVQGLGYVTSEALTYQPAESPTAPAATRPAPGALYTTNTWEYKPPAAQCIPLEMNVMLFPRQLAPYAPPDKGDILSSKEMGEPPMTLAVTGFIAIKRAVLAARADSGHHDWFHFEAPATVQAVRDACMVRMDEMVG